MLQRKTNRRNGVKSNSSLSLILLAAMAWLGQLAWPDAARADQILENFSDSLTTYELTSKTYIQDLRPQVDQRGVNIEGTLRAGAALPMAIAGNPFDESWDGQAQFSSVRLDVGTYPINDIDIALPAPGFSWAIGRSYNCRQKDSTPADYDSNGYQGRNWQQLSQPEIRLFTGSTADLDVLYLVYGADRFIEFKRANISSSQFKGKNGAAGCFEFAAGPSTAPDTYTYTDQHGNQIVFFGFDSDSGVAKGQIWKMTDPAGNTAYVGDSSTGATAISNGFDGSGRIIKAYDSADRRFTYTYSSGLLTQVKAETKASGTWSSPSGVVTVAQVDYAYYVNADSHGEDNDLKLVTITTPLTDSGVSHVRKIGYWYYEGSYDATNNPGYVHQIQYVIGSEGYRKLDYLDSTDDDDPLSASESTMKSYASAYFKYDTSRRIKSMWFNGSCGCGGGSSAGTHNFTYGTNGGFSPTSGYDTAWKNRTIVALPDGSYLTQYFDETGQPLGRVISDGDPAGSPNYWPTQAVRNSDGQLTEIDSPANATYTHSTGAFASSASVGLITVFTRVASGDMKGFVEDTKHKTASGGSAYLDGELSYTSSTKTITDVIVTRPLVASRRVYSTEVTSGTSGSYLTSYSYTMHTSDGVLMPKQITTTNPTVTTGNNGSNSATTTDQFLRPDGTTAFTRAADGIYNYTLYTNGQLAKSIADCQTNHGSDFAAGDDPNGDFGITETGDGLRKITTYAYDAQGRSDTTTLPGGMVKKSYYSQLLDHRLAVLRFNDYDSGAGPKYYGPVAYSVLNLSGKPEAQATIKLTNNESTSALTGWIDETTADLIAAATVGTVARLSTTVYDDPGSRPTESRAYFLIPGSGAGTSGVNYDAQTFGYDDSGHRWRVKQADGTIQRTVYDAIDRVESQWIGTNDNSFPGGEASPTDNMVKVSEVEYDSGGVGNGYVTTRTAFIQDSTTGQRVTTYAYDVRGRALLVTNPTAPHTFNKFDNMGRLIASGQFSSTGSIVVGTDDPTTETSNRLALNETFFDERGQVFKTTKHKITQSSGADADTLDTLTWFDAAGRTIKVDGDQLMKTAYDRLGRAVHQYVLLTTDDTVYADADDVSGDKVGQQNDTVYDATEDVVDMTAVMERWHSDLSGTGPIDSGADNDVMVYTAADLSGRIQITSYAYDRFDRKTDEVRYGTNGGSTFTRTGWSVPSRSDTELVTTWAYNTDGSLLSVTDPRALVTQYVYDDLGRQTAVINNYVNGTPSSPPTSTDDVYTRYTYSNGHKTEMWVDFDGDAVQDSIDQSTTYTYGVSKGVSAGDSLFASGSMLYRVTYPEQTGGQSASDRRTTYAYNAQGQVNWQQDAEANVTQFSYDDSGRRTQRRLTTLGGSFDSSVLRIETTYDGLGRQQLVTQYDNATVGSGTVVNEVSFAYDDWDGGSGRLVSVYGQDNNSAMSSDRYEVKYAFAKSTGGRNTIQRSTMKYNYGGSTDLATITYEYLSSGGLLDADASRVTDLKLGATKIAEYDYNGVGSLVGTTLSQPAYYSRRYSSTPGVYNDLDNFNRPIVSDWTVDLATDRDVYRVEMTLDRDGNVGRLEDRVFPTGRDVEYTMDALNRLTKAEEGTWSAGAITSRTRQELWTLDEVGNATRNKLDLNGNNSFADAGDLDDTRVFANDNGLKTQDVDTSGGVDYTFTYDKDGRLTDDGRQKNVYDGFGRLMKINSQSNALIEEFTYDGLGHRISWHYDINNSGVTNGSDPTYKFAYDERWRLVASYRASDANPKEEFFFHAAGVDGFGGSSYVDSVILRDKDANTAWRNAADGVLEQRYYYLQNWRNDTIAMVDSGNDQVEGDRWFAGGMSFGMFAGDVNGSGGVDSTDTAQIQTWITGSTYDVRGDLDRDNDVDATDKTIATGNIGHTLGKGVASHSDVFNRKGYAGYELDSVTSQESYHVRNRFYNAETQRWNTRDPIGYVDGPNLYGYVRGNPVRRRDPSGLYPSNPGYMQCAGGCVQRLLTGEIDLAGYANCLIGCVLSNPDPSDLPDPTPIDQPPPPQIIPDPTPIDPLPGDDPGIPGPPTNNPLPPQSKPHPGGGGPGNEPVRPPDPCAFCDIAFWDDPYLRGICRESCMFGWGQPPVWRRTIEPELLPGTPPPLPPPLPSLPTCFNHCKHYKPDSPSFSVCMNACECAQSRRWFIGIPCSPIWDAPFGHPIFVSLP